MTKQKTAYDVIAKLKKENALPIGAKTGVARIDGNYVAQIYLPRSTKKSEVIGKIPSIDESGIPIMIKPIEDFFACG